MLKTKQLIYASLIWISLMLNAGAQGQVPTIDWANNTVTVSATGKPPADLNNPSQSRLMALRAAKLLAYRELARLVGEVIVTDTQTINEYAQVQKIEVSGLVQYASADPSPIYHPDGSVTVTLQMPLMGGKSLASQLQLEAPKAPLPAPESKLEISWFSLFWKAYQQPEQYRAIILDASHLPVFHHLTPAICSTQNCLHPELSYSQLQAGWLHYADDLSQQQQAYTQAGLNPLILKVKSYSDGKLILDDMDLNMVYLVNQKNHIIDSKQLSLIVSK